MVEFVMRHRALIAQLLRYGLVGGFVTMLQAVTYWMLARHLAVHPQIANLAGYLVALVTGFVLHGRISFRGHDSARGSAALAARFVLVSLASLALNAGWVWLTTGLLGWPLGAPIPLMAFATPLIVFVLNKRWVFA